jgi:hypothetical protein
LTGQLAQRKPESRLYSGTNIVQFLFCQNIIFSYFLIIQHWTHNSKFFHYSIYYSFTWHCWCQIRFTKMLAMPFLWCIFCKTIANKHSEFNHIHLKYTVHLLSVVLNTWLGACLTFQHWQHIRVYRLSLITLMLFH